MAKQPEEHDNPENEVLREARLQNELAEARARDASRASVRKPQDGKKDRESGKKALDWKAAAGIGIGSAALLAALLYSKSDKK